MLPEESMTIASSREIGTAYDGAEIERAPTAANPSKSLRDISLPFVEMRGMRVKKSRAKGVPHYKYHQYRALRSTFLDRYVRTIDGSILLEFLIRVIDQA